MSSSKTWVSVVIVLIVIAGVWYVWNEMTSPGSATPESAMQPANQMASTTMATSTSDSSQMQLTTGASDMDLNADLKTIDTQSGDAASAGASANSFTDTPIPQAQ